MKFRKKPVVIEAVQWFEGDPLPEGVEMHCVADGLGVPSFPSIKTLEGWMTVSSGDWVITGVKGERYPCKPDIFEATYEPEGC